MKQHTSFGEFLDPIADKMLVITMLVLLITENSNIFFIIPALIIISREFLVIAIRQRMAEVGNNLKISNTHYLSLSLLKIESSFKSPLEFTSFPNFKIAIFPKMSCPIDLIK